MGGIANRMGMMVGESKSFLILIGIIDYFLKYIKQKHRDSGSLSISLSINSELSPLGTKGRQE